MNVQSWIAGLMVISFCAQSQVTQDSTDIQRAFSHYAKATTAFRAKDYKSYASQLKQVNHYLPYHAGILYNLSQASMLNNQKAEAFRYLSSLANMEMYYDLSRDTLFSKLMSDERFLTIQNRFTKNNQSVVKSERKFELRELNLASEGMAYDPESKTFFVSSIHKRKIISIDKNGNVNDFSSPADSLLGVYGMKVDATRNWLWTCNIAVPQMQDYVQLKGKASFLCAYDLSTGKPVHRISLNRNASQIKDITVTPDGTIYFSDMGENMIYEYKFESNPKPMVQPGFLGDALGIDCSTDGRFLFIADYLQGIFKLDRTTQKIDLLVPPSGKTLQAIDGLYFTKGKLIATQNGLRPARVIMCDLDKNYSITRASIAEANHPDYDWPTLGVIVGNNFYYIANSQWNNFGTNSEVVNLAVSKSTYILKLKF